MHFPWQSKPKPAKAAPRVIATAWPSHYREDEAYFRCRVWDPVADTAPFYMWGPRRLLSADQQVILAALVAAKPEAQKIFERAAYVHEAVEFNQDIVDPMTLEAALHLEQVDSGRVLMMKMSEA